MHDLEDSAVNELPADLARRITSLTPEKRALLLRQLAAQRRRGTPDGRHALPEIPRCARDRPLPLSFAQQRLWFLYQLNPADAAYNTPAALRLTGQLHVAALQRALSDIVRRHEALRTVFEVVDGESIQVIGEPALLPLPQVDLTALTPTAREAELLRLASEERRQPFDLVRGPVIRSTLVRLADDQHGVLLTLHHIVSDGWSMGLLVRELVALYGAYVEGRDSPLQPLAIQYADFAVWQRERLSGERLERQLDYWKRALADLPDAFPLPGERQQATKQAPRGAVHELRLPARWTEAAKRLSQVEDGSLFMTLLAAFKALLSRYSGQPDVVVGSPIANRTHPQIENLIGFFVNMLALRTRFSGEPSFRDLLGRVNHVAQNAYRHQDLPFERLVAELETSRDLEGQPLFRVVFALQNAPIPNLELPGLTLEPLAVDEVTVRFDLEIHLWEDGELLRGSLVYDAERCESTAIARLAGHYRTLLEAALDDPDQPITRLPLLSASEGHQLMIEGGDPGSVGPGARDLGELVAQRIAQRPGAVVLTADGVGFTGEELAAKSAGLASRLAAQGIGPGDRIGLNLPLGADFLATVLGLLELGAAVIPIGPDEPPSWWRGRLAAAGATALVTADEEVTGLPTIPWSSLDETAAAGAVSDRPPVEPDDSAWIAEDAGGPLELSHRVLVERIGHLQDAFGLAAGEGVLVNASPATELAAWQLFWPLTRGGFARIGGRLETLDQEGVAVAHVAAPELRAAVVSGRRPNPTRALLVSGEGPGDAGVAGSSGKLHELYLPPGAAGFVVDGRPRGGLRLLDPSGQQVPLGVIGEVVAGRAPRRVATGDRGQLAGTGELLLEPGDERVWIGDSRVNLSVVEATLLADAAVADAVVGVRTTRPRETASGARQLVAWIVPKGPFLPDQLADRLRNVLPERYLPAAWIPIVRRPLTASGDLDWDALLALEVIDDKLVERLRTKLAAQPEIAQVVVREIDRRHRVAPYHLTDVLAARSRDPADAASEDPSGTRAQSETTGPKAVCHGAPLDDDPSAPTTLVEALIATVRHRPEGRLIYLEGDRQRVETYAALLEDARRIRSGLRQAGLEPQQPVLLQLDDIADFLAAVWGCILGGFIPVAVAVPPSYRETHSVVTKLLNSWELLGRPPIVSDKSRTPEILDLPKVLNTEPLRVLEIETLRAAPAAGSDHQADPDEVASFQLTSGSTGVPKCVALSHRNIVHQIRSATVLNDHRSSDISLNWMPMDHVGSLLCYHLRDVYLGADQIHAKPEFVVEQPLRWLDWIEDYRVTQTWAPNFAYKLINEALLTAPGRSWDLSSVRFIMNGGEQVVLSVTRTFLEKLEPHGLAPEVMHPTFGMAELSSACVYSHRFDLESGAGIHHLVKSSRAGRIQYRPEADEETTSFIEVGCPIPGFSIRIVDGADRLVPEDTIGRIQFQGPNVMPGYHANPEANAAAFTADGWFNSGDLGFLRQGCLTITGREKDVIILHGVNYFSHEIESVVEEVDGVEPTFAAACAVTDEGAKEEQLAIFFTPRDGIRQIADVVREIRSSVARRMGIQTTYVVPVQRADFPKTTSGKISRVALRRELESGAYDDTVKRLDLELGHRTLPAWFFRRTWRPRRLRRAEGQAKPVSLVLTPRSGPASALMVELERRPGTWIRVDVGAERATLSPRHFQIDPTCDRQTTELLDQLADDGLRPVRVVHLGTWQAPADSQPADRLEQELERGLYSLLTLLQALEPKAASEVVPIRLLVVSSHLQSVADGDPVACERAPLLGLLKSVDAEAPWLTVRHLDLPLDADPARAAGWIDAELGDGTVESEVAYRAGRRWVPRLETLDLPTLPAGDLPLQRRGVYLVSGGLGGIAQGVAAFLLERFQARLLLIGRTVLPPRHDWPEILERGGAVADRIRALESLRGRGGEVVYRAVDVASSDALAATVADATEAWGGRLDGIFHLAGVFEQRWVAAETRESLARVMRPKVEGTIALHRLLPAAGEALFVVFSSVNGFFGGASMAGYSAASSFQQAFVRQMNRGTEESANRPRCIDIAWSLWDQVGMGRDYRGKEAAEGSGFRTLAATDGLHSLLAVLHRQESRVLVGLDPEHPDIQRLVEGPAEPRRQLAAFYTVRPGEVLPDAVFEALEARDRFGVPCAFERIELAEMPRGEEGQIDLAALEALVPSRATADGFVEPTTEVECRIAVIWQDLLGVSRVGLHDNFFALGGHSLLATRCVSRMKEAFAMEIAVSDLFEAPTVAALARLLEDRDAEESEEDFEDLLSDIENLTADELAEALVEEEQWSS